MKVLFDHDLPFSLAHGGMQHFVSALMKHVARLGVDAEPLRWWDSGQRGDIIHFVQKPRPLTLEYALRQGYRTVLTEFMDKVCSESILQLWLRRQACRLLRRVVPLLDRQLNIYHEVDELVYVVPHELDVIRYLYDVPATRGRVIPLALEEETLAELTHKDAEEDYLICVATITPRKNILLLAQSAKEAGVPVLFVGRPYTENDPYFRSFLAEVDNHCVRYDGWKPEGDKLRLLRRARGFVLLSQFESGSCAVQEAAAAGLPLLLSRLPWAVSGLPQRDTIHYTGLDKKSIVRELTQFHGQARRQSGPIFPVQSWTAMARQYLDLYETVCGKIS